jgi:hypothetical protein
MFDRASKELSIDVHFIVLIKIRRLKKTILIGWPDSIRGIDAGTAASSGPASAAGNVDGLLSGNGAVARRNKPRTTAHPLTATRPPAAGPALHLPLQSVEHPLPATHLRPVGRWRRVVSDDGIDGIGARLRHGAQPVVREPDGRICAIRRCQFAPLRRHEAHGHGVNREIPQQSTTAPPVSMFPPFCSFLLMRKDNPFLFCT